MRTYELLYRRVGTRKIKNFLNPLIINSDTFIFPRNSMLLIFRPSDILVTFGKETSILKNVPKTYVYTELAYPENTLGKFNKKTIPYTSIVTAMKSNERSFKYLKQHQVNLPIKNIYLLLVTYGALNYTYRYVSNPISTYYKWYNNFAAVIEGVSKKFKTDRHKYIMLDVPTELPKRIDLDLAVKRMSVTILDKVPTYQHLNIVELWKYLTPEYKKESLLNNIKSSDLPNITLILNIDTKMILLNLGILTATVKEYPYKGNIAEYPASTMRKLLYIMLYKLIKLAGVADEDIREDNSTTDVNIKDMLKNNSLKKTTPISKNNTDNSDEVNIDVLLDNEVIEKDVTSIKNDGVDTEPGLDDLDESDEELTTTEISDAVEENIINKYNKLEDVLAEKINPHKKMMKELTVLKSYKMISNKTYSDIENTLINQYKLPTPFKDGPPNIGELLDNSKDDLTINNDQMNTTPTAVVFDTRHNKNTIAAIDKKYIKEQYKKDLTRVIYSLQNNNIIVEDYTIDEVNTVLDNNQIHKIRIKTIGGRASTITINLPKIEEDGTFKLSNNIYRMRKLRADIPIRKINIDRVALSSNYGKIFIEKASAKKDDAGYWLKKQLANAYETNEDIKKVIFLPSDNIDVELPKVYSLLSRYTKSFRYKTMYFYFEYNKRDELLENLLLTDIEKLEEQYKLVLVGTDGNKQLYMNFENKIFVYDGNSFKETIDILSIIGLTLIDIPIEYSSIKIYKRSLPTVILLAYYLGLSDLFRLLNVTVSIIDSGKRVNLADDQYRVVFKDKTLIITRDNGLGDIILYGLTSIATTLKTVQYTTMDNKNSFAAIFSKLELPALYINEIKMLENMFVDPVTESALIELKEPTTFKGLLIRASELLKDDYYNHPNNIQEMTLKGYERVSGMLYKELISSMKEHENRGHFGKSKLTVYPYSIIDKIRNDSTTVLVDDLNPISFIRQSENVTYIGEGGRSKEGMSRDTRIITTSEIGIMSESSPDSGDVGISAYMSADPKLTDIRGNVGDVTISKDGMGSVLSTSAMLSPFADMDDTKRTNFIGIMNGHTVPIKNSSVPYVRTGYESIIPIKTSDKFAVTAVDDGVVLKVTKKSIEVEYKTAGIKKYTLGEWTTKEESGGCYTHNVIANLNVKDTFKKDDTITYDELFFEPDIFNPKRVIYKQGTMVTVCVMDDTQTYEDSAAISNKMYKALGTVVTKAKSIVVSKDDNILNIKKLGDKITPTDTLFTVTDSILNVDKLDERALSILQELKSISPKAKVNGVINKINVYYNCEFTELSKTLQELVKLTDAELIQNTGYPGRVSSGYSIQGIPLHPDTVEIKIYIKVDENMGVGDKAILANQLKFTVGEVFDYDMTAVDGREIDLVFSATAIAARIVNSPDLIGTTSSLLEKISENAVNIYFN